MSRLRLATVAALTVGLAAALVSALVITLSASGGTQEIELDGVGSDALDSWGVRLLSPNGKPDITALAAEQIADQRKPGADVKEVVLVRVVNERLAPVIDRLAWAVNFDPASILPIPDLGPGGPNPPEWNPCDEAVAFDVLLIDASSGEFIFEMQQSADAGDQPCPTTPLVDINITPSPSP